MCNCIPFLCVVLMREVTPVYCERNPLIRILLIVSFNRARKKWPWSSTLWLR